MLMNILSQKHSAPTLIMSYRRIRYRMRGQWTRRPSWFDDLYDIYVRAKEDTYLRDTSKQCIGAIWTLKIKIRLFLGPLFAFLTLVNVST